MKYLTNDEFVALQDVCTTAEEAQQIIARCSAILKALKADENYTNGIGCPHCLKMHGAYQCRNCAYPLRNAGDKGYCYCCTYAFAGWQLADCEGLVFTDDGAALDIAKAWRLDTVGVITEFLEAHIEWARNLTPAPKSWRTMSVEEQDQWRKEHA